MAPSIAARRVDGVQGARCPKGSAEMAALSVPRARTFESNLPPDEEYGRYGRTRCAADKRPALNRTSTFSYRSMIIGVSNGNERTPDAPGSLWTRLRWVLKRRRARSCCVVTPARQSRN